MTFSIQRWRISVRPNLRFYITLWISIVTMTVVANQVSGAAMSASCYFTPGLETVQENTRAQKSANKLQKRLERFEKRIVRRAERLMESGNGSNLALLAGIFGVLALSFFQSGKEKHTKTCKTRKAKEGRGEGGTAMSWLTFGLGVGGAGVFIFALIVGWNELFGLIVFGLILAFFAFIFGLITFLDKSDNTKKTIALIGFIPSVLVLLFVIFLFLGAYG